MKRVCRYLLPSLAVALGCPACASPPTGIRTTFIVKGGTVITMNAAQDVLSPGAVAIQGSRIAAVGTPDDIARRYRAAEVIDATDQVVLPGLINTHTHAPMVLYRGLADDLALMEWLERYIFPAEARTVSPEMVRVGTSLAAVEMIRSGTTTFVDMYYFEEEIARAAKAAGLRGVLGQTVIGFPVPDARTPAEALARAERFIKAFAGDELIVPAVAPHALYTTDADALTAARALANVHRVPLLIHLAETREEVRIARERFRQSPVGYLGSIGVWAGRTLAAHAVHVEESDVAVLKAAGVGLSHNPESNMKLASGIAPVGRFLAEDLAVGLGTDGAASNNDLDMFEAMRQAALLHKLATGDPRAVAAPVALEMATRRGARAVGLDGEIGSLEPGKRADLIVVSMASPRQTPLYDPISHLVYATRGDDVTMTMVNGRVLMRDRRVLSLDENRVLGEARAFAVKVREAVGREKREQATGARQ